MADVTCPPAAPVEEEQRSRASAEAPASGLDTSTSYLGLRLPHPFIAGASPFGYRLDGIKRLEDAGCAAVVLHSLFEEQISLRDEGRIHQAEPIGTYQDVFAQFPAAADFPLGPDGYAEHISRVKQAVDIPIIGSLNGVTAESWLKFAVVIEQAGADALELNPYEVVTDINMPAAAIEYRLVQVVRNLKRILQIPVAVKLSPFFTAFANMAHQLDEAGADALVLFNRFYQSDIDIKTSKPSVRLELSTSNELPLRLHWVALLCGRVRPALAVTGGVATPNDGVKAILAGADVVQIVSALLRHGPAHVSTMRRGLEQWMEWNRVSHLGEVRGRASFRGSTDLGALERANYIRTLQCWCR